MPTSAPGVFRFTVDVGGTSVGFSEVSGLTSENQVSAHRRASFRDDVPCRAPALPRFGNITLKRGLLSGGKDLIAWLGTGTSGAVERRDLTITLLNDAQEPVMTWKVANAFPVKVVGPGLEASGNEVAIESIELAHEGLELQPGQRRPLPGRNTGP